MKNYVKKMINVNKVILEYSVNNVIYKICIFNKVKMANVNNV